MCLNLTSICRKLGDRNLHGFQEALKKLEEAGWNRPQWPKDRLRQDDHRDAKSFQAALKYLRDVNHLDLGPFYIAVDESGRAFRVN
jgi:hypothetical protein